MFTALFRLILSLFPLVGSLARADAPPDLRAFLAANHYGTVVTQEDNNHQYFTAQMNGQEVRFILDSGAGRTVISHSCADRLKLSLKQTNSYGSGVGGRLSEAAGLAAVSSFTINSWSLNRLQVIPVVSADFGAGHADGLFGFEYLRLNSALIVAGSSGFLIRPGLRSAPPSLAPYLERLGYKSVPLRIFENKLMVSGMVSGRPFSAQVDSGAAMTTFSDRFISQSTPTRYTGQNMRGIDGRELPTRVFAPSTMTIGSYTVRRDDYYTIDSPLFVNGEEALLGYDFLVNCRAIIDAGSALLWLK